MNAPGFLTACARETERRLAALLDARAHVVPGRLLAAMRHSLLGGGKRIRPALVLESYRAAGGRDPDEAWPAALAIECLHTYSLIHDDLPAMDDDDLRRGRPTCHRQFDEATAILAGDALQALAFELLTDAGPPARAAGLVRSLAVAAGCQGMVGGQMLDIEGDAQRLDDVLAVERIHVHKTGALIRWCMQAGAMLANAPGDTLDRLERYGEAVGLLFQVADDILDATATTEALGKRAGQDARMNKATFVSLLGLARARERAEEMRRIAIEAVEPLGAEGGHLVQLADYILERSR